MTLRDDVLAVRQNDALSQDEKRQAIYDLKGTAIVSLFAPRVGQTFTRGAYALTLLKIPRYLSNRALELYVRVTKNGVEVPLDLPIQIVNPPIMVPDATQPDGLRLDVVQAIRDVLIGLVK